MKRDDRRNIVRRFILQGLLYVLLILGICTSVVPSAHSATVSGNIVIPDSDMGYKPNLLGMNSRVRVEGTDISANVIAANRDEGSFTLTNVPPGSNTLLFVEANTDIFTQSSKRVQVNVVGDLTGVSFNLVYHWKGLAGYPPNWGTTGYVNEWVPHFVSDQVGFILFRVRGAGIDPERVELYRTVNGGETWDEIGHWVSGAPVYPDFLNRYLYFADQNHGVIQALVDVNQNPNVTWYHTQGVLYTSDGGATWNYSDFPNPPEATASGDIVVGRFAGISDTHWIACGSNGGTSSYGLPNYQVIWETTNSGQNWEIKMYWQEDYGACTALGADANGKAIAFFTPYAWGGAKKVALRDASGNWTIIDNNELITNSGYGPADIPMLGDRAWVRNDDHSTQPVGLYRTDNAGLTWEKISDSLPQYMAFATENKGFAPAGGPAYVSYDGGLTWLYQSGGGGSCCHGNNIWAFDATHAVWHDIGVGDPDSTAALFTYVEPWEANFEITPGVPISSGFFRGGALNVPVASYKLFNHGPVPIRINGITIRASGTGNDQSGISQVNLWHDRNANGYVDPGDVLLGQGVYPSDDGVLTISFAGGLALNQLNPLYLLVAYDFTYGVAQRQTFTCSLTANDVDAERTDTNDPISPTAPPNYPLAGRAAASGEKTIDFDRDGKADIAVWRPGDGVWYVMGSSAGFMWSQWGQPGDVMVPGDYDGDWKTDVAFWRPGEGNWYIKRSSDGVVTTTNWGLGAAPYNDIPVPGDYDGDGKTDLAVWRPGEGNWYIKRSSDGVVTTTNWGLGAAPYNDIPVPGDYDGDGKTDVAVWRPGDGVWYIRHSSDQTVVTRAWGAGSLGDIPVPGDYDGDGKTDIAVWRPGDGVWYIRRSSDQVVTTQAWGAGSLGDIPVPGDYDGDGKTDIAVWRPGDGVWYIRRSSDQVVTTRAWGAGSQSDHPVCYNFANW